MSDLLEREAEALRARAYQLGDLLAEKCRAYGGAHNRQTDLWRALLRPYEAGPGEYRIPVELVYHIPRLTRVLDRILRIVANPATDPMGEDPWGDLAGDALAGAVMPKPAPARVVCGRPLPTPWSGTCEREPWHEGRCERFGAMGVIPTRDELPDPGTCSKGARLDLPYSVHRDHQCDVAAGEEAGSSQALLGEEHPRGFEASEEESQPAGRTIDFPNPAGPGTICGRRFHAGPEGTLRVCARFSLHDGPHIDDRGRMDPSFRGVLDEESRDLLAPEHVCGASFPTVVGARECALATGHPGAHRCERGLVDERDPAFVK